LAADPNAVAEGMMSNPAPAAALVLMNRRLERSTTAEYLPSLVLSFMAISFQ
jgi:hypothetical protein